MMPLQHAKILSLFSSSLFLLSVLSISGCIENSKNYADSSSSDSDSISQDDVGEITIENINDITEPYAYFLNPYVIEGNAICLVNESRYEGVPIIAPLLKTRNLMISIAWKDESDEFKKNKLDYTELDFEDVSDFSSRIAITFYKNTFEPITPAGKKAVVVNSYENALLVGPLASILDLPILFYGKTTNEALWRIGARSLQDVIAVGNVPYEKSAGVILQTQEDIHNYTIDASKGANLELNYLVVTNPDDREGLKSHFPQSLKTPYTLHLSSFASLFAIYRKGLVISVANGSDAPSPYKIDMSIESPAARMEERGMHPRFLLMLGDSVSLPFAYYWLTEFSTTLIATDNVYASILGGMSKEGYETNEKNYGFPTGARVPSLANGRIVAKNLSVLAMYFDRMVNYDCYLSIKSAPILPQMDIIPFSFNLPLEWNNNVLAYNGIQAEFSMPEEIQTLINLWESGKFNAKECSVEAKSLDWVGLGNYISEYMSASNFIVAGADHGSPQGNTVQYSDILKMPPNVNFQVSCSTGRIDNYYNYPEPRLVTKNDSFVYSMLENGVGALVAATAPVGGWWTGSYPMIGITFPTYTAGDLGYYFMDVLISQNISVGEALVYAKGDADPGEALAYTLYGDPGLQSV